MASNNKNTNNSQSNDDDWITDLILSLFKAAGYLLWWAVLFRAISIPIIASVAIVITHGPRPGLWACPRLVDTGSGGLCRLIESIFVVDRTDHTQR